MIQTNMVNGAVPGPGSKPFRTMLVGYDVFPNRTLRPGPETRREPIKTDPKDLKTMVKIADSVVGPGEPLDAKIFKVMAFGDLPAKNGTDLRGYEVYVYDFHPETEKGESIGLDVRSKAMLNGGREGSVVIFLGEKEYQIRISENPGALLSKRIEVFEIQSVSERR